MTAGYLFVSKPQHVEAVQWAGENAEVVQAFAPGKVRFTGNYELRLHAGKHGAQGWLPVPVGHWIVSRPGDRSDVWPVEDGHFRATYEPANGAAVAS